VKSAVFASSRWSSREGLARTWTGTKTIVIVVVKEVPGTSLHRELDGLPLINAGPCASLALRPLGLD
jgi:hypothetical protein